jgi:O-antigen/teichoic acid export membrane protein
MGYVFLGAAYFLQLGSFLTMRTGTVGLVSTAAAILNLIANYFLIIHFGMLGAAWATVLGFVALAAGSYYCSEQVCPLGLPIGRVVRMLGVAVALYLFGCALPPSGLATALLCKVFLVACFPVLIWACGCVSHEEVATVRSVRDGAVRRTLQLMRPAWRRA